jgi:hypothetical protein
MYSEAEIAFLTQSHRVETADRRSRTMPFVTDLRQIGCPPHIFNRILEDRARRLGRAFAEWRTRRGESSPQDDLDARVAASKLW